MAKDVGAVEIMRYVLIVTIVAMAYLGIEGHWILRRL